MNVFASYCIVKKYTHSPQILVQMVKSGIARLNVIRKVQTWYTLLCVCEFLVVITTLSTNQKTEEVYT